MPETVLTSNILLKAAEWRQRVMEFPDAIDRAVGANAALLLKESILEIDRLIYSQAEPPGYHRTKNLRRSNKIKKLAMFTWLVYNDAAYAGFVHDGTSRMLPRPWMRNAVAAKQDTMTENLVRAGTEALEQGGVQTSVDVS